MKQLNDTQMVRCPAGYLVQLNSSENDISKQHASKKSNQSKKDMIAGFLFVLIFGLALFVSLMM